MSKKQMLFIPFLLESQNKSATNHWTKNHKTKNDIKDEVNKILKQFEHIKFKKVKLHFQPVLGTEATIENGKRKRSQRKRDIVNNATSVKFFEDLIVRSGMLVDDTNDFVVSHYNYKNVVDRNFKGHGMMIMIEEVADDYVVAECFEEYFKELKKENYIDLKKLELDYQKARRVEENKNKPPKIKKERYQSILKVKKKKKDDYFANTLSDVDLKNIMKKFNI